MEEQPNYYAIIPADVRYDERLKLGEKMIYGEITSLTFKTGECWASNNYFAKLYKVTPQAISKWIKSLEKYNYIIIVYEKEGKLITKRIIKLVTNDIDRVSTTVDRGINSCLEGYQHTIKENIINNNIIKETNNINIISKESKKIFIPPTLEEVKDYCLNNRHNKVDYKRYYDYYTASNWKDSSGKKVKSWKQKVILWESDEPKDTSNKGGVVYETI